MPDTRIGLVGAGFMGQLAHLSNYHRVDECEVAALAEPRENLAEAVAGRYGVPQVYEDHAELLADADVDAVVAVQPYQRHAFVVPDVLEAGYPLFTEKPIAVRPETGDELATLAEERDLVYTVGYHKRSDPAMEYAKGLVDRWRASGEYGGQRFVRITMPSGDWIGGAPDPIRTDEEPPQGPRETPPSAFDDATAEAYDRFVNFYIHQVNALRYLFCEPYDLTYADDRLLVAESESGTTGTIELSPYQTSDDWQESVLVGFDRAYVRVDLPPPLASQAGGRVEVLRDDDGTETVRPTMPNVSAMRRQAENFVAAVEGRREPPCDAREAVDDLRIAREYISRRYR